jgi:hypothetical protein
MCDPGRCDPHYLDLILGRVTARLGACPPAPACEVARTAVFLIREPLHSFSPSLSRNVADFRPQWLNQEMP